MKGSKNLLESEVGLTARGGGVGEQVKGGGGGGGRETAD